MGYFSIWTVENGYLEKVWGQIYPNSLGLFYSAITKRLGLKPNEDEYITMGMAAYGEPLHRYVMVLSRRVA